MRKTPDPALRKALTIVGTAVGGSMLLLCGLCGVVAVATGDDEPDVRTSVSAAPVGVDRLVPSAAATTAASTASPTTSPTASPSPVASPSPSPTPTPAVPKPPTTRQPATKRPAPKQPPAPPKTTKPTPPPPPQDEPDDVYYANCAAARAAGAAPLHVGEPGYRRALDRDGDGVACE